MRGKKKEMIILPVFMLIFGMIQTKHRCGKKRSMGWLARSMESIRQKLP
jgi:hypothetical protein